MRAIETSYGKSKFFSDYINDLKDIYRQNWDRLLDLNLALISLCIDWLGLPCKILLASNLDLSDPDNWNLAICRKLKADKYLSGDGSQGYLDIDAFHENNIKCIYTNYAVQPYEQLHGPFDPAGANKATHFFQLCDQADIPIIFLNNITGYMVGTEYEHQGMIKHGAKMIQAVTNVRVPRIALYIGASFGAGNYGMCGYAYEPDFLFAWPNSSTGVMGGEQAGRVMSIIARAGAERKGVDVDEDALREREQGIARRIGEESKALFITARVWDDGIIDPRDSRRVLIHTLRICAKGDARALRPTSFGVARM